MPPTTRSMSKIEKVRNFETGHKAMKKYLRSAHEPPASFAGGPSPLTLYTLHQVKIIRTLCEIGGVPELENISVFDVGCGYGTFLMTAWCSGCDNIAGVEMGSPLALSDSLHNLVTTMKKEFHELPRLNMRFGLDISQKDLAVQFYHSVLISPTIKVHTVFCYLASFDPESLIALNKFLEIVTQVQVIALVGKTRAEISLYFPAWSMKRQYSVSGRAVRRQVRVLVRAS
jgi:hypothetical protein